MGFWHDLPFPVLQTKSTFQSISDRTFQKDLRIFFTVPAISAFPPIINIYIYFPLKTLDAKINKQDLGKRELCLHLSSKYCNYGNLNLRKS